MSYLYLILDGSFMSFFVCLVSPAVCIIILSSKNFAKIRPSQVFMLGAQPKLFKGCLGWSTSDHRALAGRGRAVALTIGILGLDHLPARC